MPILSAIISIALDEAQRKLLAVWLMKTAMMFESKDITEARRRPTLELLGGIQKSAGSPPTCHVVWMFFQKVLSDSDIEALALS
jgi:hypothetical protein